MAMAVDSRQQGPFHTMGYDTKMNYDAMRYPAPQFTNPWVSAPSSQGQMYSTSLPATTMSSDPSRYAVQQAPAVSHAYSSAPTTTSLASGMLPPDPDLYNQSGLQVPQQDGLPAPRPYAAQYTSAPSGTTYAATSAPAPSYTSAPYGYQSDRRTSHPSVPPSNPGMAYSGGTTYDAHALREQSLSDFNNRLNSASHAERQSFSDALDASRGMVAMSQSDITPRNIYGHSNSSNNSSDGYGFPASQRHSAHSSISSASTYPTYYNSSVSEASVGDYSSASESVDMPTSRTLPRPNGLNGGGAGAFPPAPSSMMGQFSSKVSSSSQKKHKCKICDKRFTRPSSLQTHMYSHTGEKPFACDVDGCGRHFSVVSNLRRHKKVHRGEGGGHGSGDESD